MDRYVLRDHSNEEDVIEAAEAVGVTWTAIVRVGDGNYGIVVRQIGN
jgi:hypothetical protein